MECRYCHRDIDLKDNNNWNVGHTMVVCSWCFSWQAEKVSDSPKTINDKEKIIDWINNKIGDLEGKMKDKGVAFYLIPQRLILHELLKFIKSEL